MDGDLCARVFQVLRTPIPAIPLSPRRRSYPLLFLRSHSLVVCSPRHTKVRTEQQRRWLTEAFSACFGWVGMQAIKWVEMRQPAQPGHVSPTLEVRSVRCLVEDLDEEAQRCWRA